MARFRLKELAVQRDLTADELARKSGVKMSTIQKIWQNKTREPTYSTLAAIAGALGVSIEDLVEPAQVTGQADGESKINKRATDLQWASA